MKGMEVIPVREVMSQEVVCVQGVMSVTEVLHKMKDLNLKAVLIDKRHDADEYGIVLLSDISRQVLAKDRAPDRVNVYEIMTKPVVSVRPEMNIRYCARLFDRFHLHYAPVITNEGELVGIVSHADMVLRGMCRFLSEPEGSG